jgi:ParB/RepB/Spo0J family partition protein
MAADQVKFVDISKIHWEPRARLDLGAIEQLTESIKEKGVIQPITIRTDFLLLAGERRVTAARAAGLTKIPALIRDTKNDVIDELEIELVENVFRKDFEWDEQAKLIAKIDAHCKDTKSEWSTRKTAQLLGQSHPMNVVRALKLVDAMALLPEIAECKTQDEALKMVKKLEEGLITNELRKRQETASVENRGLHDMLRIAKANYKIGDALKEMAALKEGFNVSLIEVDPPYGIDLNALKKQTDGTNLVNSYKEVEGANYQAFTEIVAAETYRLAGKDCWMVYWYGPTHHHLIFTALTKAGWLVDDIPAIWSKKIGQVNAPEIYLARTYEPFFICRKGKPVLNKRGRSNVFDFVPDIGTKKYHPTQRPIALMEEILETFTIVSPSTTVLVPFLGSGATLRACYNYGVRGFGWDLNPEYRDKFLLAVEEDTKKLDSEKKDEDDGAE